MIEIRSKAFENLTISEAYKGYFFLQDHINKLQESMLISLREKRVKAQERKAKRLSGIFTGKIKPIKLLKKVFLTNKNLLL